MGEMLHDGATLADVAKAMLDGALSGFLLNQMCFIKGIGPFIGVALAAYGYYAQIEALNQAIQDGDYLTAVFKSVQLITSATAIADSCFTGDTLVAVDGGQKRIDEIEVGDKVWAYNVETGETELKSVAKVFVHSVYEILHLYTDEGNIDTTTNHPFYVIGKGWVAAGDLAASDEVYNLDGTTSTILGSEIEVLDEPVLVYNLEVEDFHSYFVGCVPVLVHNVCHNPYGKKGGSAHQQKTQDVINDISSRNTNGSRNFAKNKIDNFEKEMMFKIDKPGYKPYKPKRFADVVEYGANGDVIAIYQIGKVSGNGLPVSRESKAIADIMNSKAYNGAPIYFIPYNSNSGPIIYL